MALVKHVTAQTDFSAGEVDSALKRDDEHPVRKAGLRQCANFRILNSRGLANRFGRSARFLDGPRVDEVLMGPGLAFELCFSANTLKVRQPSGAIVATFTNVGYLWTAATFGQIVWAVYQKQIFITFPGMQPLVVTWVPPSTFSVAPYTEIFFGVQKRTPFYRISPHDITLDTSSYKGTTNLTFSAGVLTPGTAPAGSIGTRIRYIGRQILITGVGTPGPDGLSATGTGTIQEPLFKGATILTNATDITTIACVGDVAIGSISGAKALITAVIDATHFSCQFLTGVVFLGSGSNDEIICPGGSLGVQQGAPDIGTQAVTVWDEEVMNPFRGWPASCFVDQNRLGFCNFNSVPSGVCWSAIGFVTDLYDVPTQTTPDSSIFELVPAKSQVYFVAAGAESDEFVFCDNAIYWVPISATNPLAPGSVAFNQIDEGVAPIQPRFMRGAIIYINAGSAFVVRAICATGAYNRPYEARTLSEFHGHLFNNIQAIAAPNGDGSFTERYFYVLNGDGTVVGCKVLINDGQIKDPPGWFRINGVGTINWISARLANVWFATTYPGASGPMAELLDNSQYLDGAIFVNAPPAQLIPPGGKGPLWWAPGHPVTVMDQGTRQMGTYQTDANGFLIPQFFGGENLASLQLVAGQAWTAIMEPFMASPPPGQDVSQRLVKRQVANAAVYVASSTGFVWARLFSGPLTPGGPALGDIIGTRRVPTYNMDDNATLPPPLREEAQLWRPLGASYDQRIAIVKDTSGPLTVLEFAAEITV